MAFCAEFLGMIHPDKARGGEGRSFLFSLGVVISQGRGAHTAAVEGSFGDLESAESPGRADQVEKTRCALTEMALERERSGLPAQAYFGVGSESASPSWPSS